MIQIADGGEVELAVTGGELGDVSDPTMVRCAGGEVASQQVRHPTGVGSATPPLLRRMGSDQPVRTHQPSDMGAGNAVTATAELADHSGLIQRGRTELKRLSNRSREDELTRYEVALPVAELVDRIQILAFDVSPLVGLKRPYGSATEPPRKAAPIAPPSSRSARSTCSRVTLTFMKRGLGTAWANVPSEDLVVVLTQRAADQTGMPAVCAEVLNTARNPN